MAKAKKTATLPVSSKPPRVIAAGEFKAHCLQLMDQVFETGESITITKRGKAVAKLVPEDQSKPFRPLYGRMKGMMTIKGDIMAPIDVEWGADAENL